MKNQRSNFYVQSRGVCEQTGKKRFFYTSAFRVSRYEQRRYHSNHHPYLCTSCGDFHVGSSEAPAKLCTAPSEGRKDCFSRS